MEAVTVAPSPSQRNIVYCWQEPITASWHGKTPAAAGAAVNVIHDLYGIQVKQVGSIALGRKAIDVSDGEACKGLTEAKPLCNGFMTPHESASAHRLLQSV